MAKKKTKFGIVQWKRVKREAEASIRRLKSEIPKTPDGAFLEMRKVSLRISRLMRTEAIIQTFKINAARTPKGRNGK